MKITFVSNFMNHHQMPFSDAMYKLTGGEYAFIACIPFDSRGVSAGYVDENKSKEYIIRPYENKEQKEKAERLMAESDVVIFGSGDDNLFQLRMKYTDKLTFRNSERFFKKGIHRRFLPTTFMSIYKGYVRYKNCKNFNVLCSSAYTSYDLKLCGFNDSKCFKWGYFPEFEKENFDSLMKKKEQNTIVWAGRFIDWKHPELPILVAERLKKEGYDFKLYMIGSGEMEETIKKLVIEKNLSDCITLTGSMPPLEVREYMKKSSIFIATSNFQEGWGAVVNEGMSSGCACVVSDAMGAAPYLIQDGVNGMLYKNPSLDDLTNKLKILLKNRNLCEKLGREAHKTINEEWNPQNAAEKFLKLADDISSGNPHAIESGVCSRAKVLKNGYRRKDL